MDTHEQEAKRQELARSLNCITSAELRALAGITQLTEVAWRKRHAGPAYIRVGREYFYPRQAVEDFMHSRVRERVRISAKAIL
jgi:hypothetical protein